MKIYNYINIYDLIIFCGLLFTYFTTYILFKYSLKKAYPKFQCVNTKLIYTPLMVRKNLLNLNTNGRSRLLGFYVMDMFLDIFILLALNQLIKHFDFFDLYYHQATLLVLFRSVFAILEKFLLLLITNFFPFKNHLLCLLSALFTLFKHFCFLGYILLFIYTFIINCF